MRKPRGLLEIWKLVPPGGLGEGATISHKPLPPLTPREKGLIGLQSLPWSPEVHRSGSPSVSTPGGVELERPLLITLMSCEPAQRLARGEGGPGAQPTCGEARPPVLAAPTAVHTRPLCLPQFNNMLLYCVPRVIQVGAHFQVWTRIDVAGMKVRGLHPQGRTEEGEQQEGPTSDSVQEPGCSRSGAM